MTLGWAVLFWASIAWMAPLMYCILKNSCKPKKNIIVGVTLPYGAERDPQVLSALERFRREMKWVCLGMLGAILPCLFIRDMGVAMTVWFIWLVAVCFVFFIPYVRCNKALRRVKEERGWRRGKESPQAVTDLKAAAEEVRWLSPWWFLPPLLISLIPLFFDRELWWLWALDAAMVPVFYACYRFLYRKRSEVVDCDTGRTLALSRIRRYNWGKCWLILAWATGVFNLGMWLTMGHIWLFMAVVLGYSLAVCISVLRIEFRVRRLQEQLGNSRGEYVDEDDRWIWGLIYYNPHDARLTVNARVGINVSLNMARRPAQLLMGLCLALLLACPLIGVWLTGMERAPVELTATQTELIGSHYGGEWRVALDEVESAQLVDELPRLRRVAGTGMESALTGAFRADGWGALTCCLDPRTGPWLLIKREDGALYLFGSSTEGEVEALLPLLP